MSNEQTALEELEARNLPLGVDVASVMDGLKPAIQAHIKECRDALGLTDDALAKRTVHLSHGLLRTLERKLQASKPGALRNVHFEATGDAAIGALVVRADYILPAHTLRTWVFEL